jgi:hypothetical protein
MHERCSLVVLRHHELDRCGEDGAEGHLVVAVAFEVLQDELVVVDSVDDGTTQQSLREDGALNWLRAFFALGRGLEGGGSVLPQETTEEERLAGRGEARVQQGGLGVVAELRHLLAVREAKADQSVDQRPRSHVHPIDLLQTGRVPFEVEVLGHARRPSVWRWVSGPISHAMASRKVLTTCIQGGGSCGRQRQGREQTGQETCVHDVDGRHDDAGSSSGGEARDEGSRTPGSDWTNEP